MAEVAGLVFGSIPLLISALEHASDIAGPINRLFRWKRHRDQQISELNYCSVSYDQTLRILLKDVVDDEELVDMLQDPQNSIWSSPELVEDLKDKLGSAYDSCMSTISEMDSVMRDIAGSIQRLGGASRVQQDGLRAVLNANPPSQNPLDGSKLFNFATGLRYTMTNRRIKQSLETLRRCNQRLDEFINKASRIQEDFAPTLPKINFVMPVDDIRQNATQIYSAMSRSWCAFHETHSAAWPLESRIKRRKFVGRRTIEGVRSSKPKRFDLSVLDSSVMIWLHTAFGFQENAEPIISPRQGPRVMLIEDASERRSTDVPRSLVPVTNMCSTLNRNTKSAIEFRLDHEGSLRYFSRNADQSQSHHQRGETLDALLPKLKLGAMMEFYMLTISMITTLVHLGGTPWMRKQWTKEDIVFFDAKGNSPDDVDILRPHLINQHRRGVVSNNGHAIWSDIDRSNIATLGIMLLEMQTGRRIEDFRTPDDGPFNTGSNLVVAVRVLDRLYRRGSLSEGLRKATTYCLQSSINPATSLTDRQFVDAFIAQTVGPLEKERRVLMGR